MLFAGTGVVLDGPLILFFEGRTPHFRARNLPFSLLKEMGPPEAQRESVQRAAAAKSDPRP